jgi:hypothetical protein
VLCRSWFSRLDRFGVIGGVWGHFFERRGREGFAENAEKKIQKENQNESIRNKPLLQK